MPAEAKKIAQFAADSPLADNLAALWAMDPALAEIVDALGDGDEYPVQSTRSGDSTLAMPVPSAKGQVRANDAIPTVYLHSRHAPADEARRLVESLSLNQKTTFHVLGLGLGYHLQLLFERASSEAIICVFEPDPRMIRTAFRHRDFTILIRSGRVMWFHRPDKTELVSRLTPHTALVYLGSQTVPHAPSIRLHEAFFRQVSGWIDEFAAVCRTSMNTLVINGLATARNISLNLGWYVATPGVGRLKNRFAGKPAVIVSAGPSLRKNKHLLKDLQDRAVMIAVQTTLQPLLEMGVRPRFVTSLDYHEICQRFFERLPPDLQTELIAEPKATHRIFQMMTGPVTLIGSEFAESLVRELRIGKAGLTSSATVAHLAFYLAEHLGCDPIIFVGQDLGFSDGLCYTPGTSYEDVWRPELSRFCTVEMKQWEQIVRDRRILRKIPDYRGQPMYTEERLFAYLQQFERDFARSSARIIDATEGGALKRGAQTMPLADAIAQYCARPIPNLGIDRPPMQWDLLESARRSVLLRRDEAGQIAGIARQTLPLLEDIRDHTEDQALVNLRIARIDELRRRMEQHGKTYELVMQFTQGTELRRFQHDRELAAARAEGLERQRRQVQRDIANVQAVIDAAGQFAELMTEVDGTLARQSEMKEAA